MSAPLFIPSLGFLTGVIGSLIFGQELFFILLAAFASVVAIEIALLRTTLIFESSPCRLKTPGTRITFGKTNKAPPWGLLSAKSKRWHLLRSVIMVVILGFAYGLIHKQEPVRLTQSATVRIKGRIVGEVKRSSKSQSFDFISQSEIPFTQGSGGKIKLAVQTDDPREFQWGDLLELRGVLAPLKGPRNPGEFDERAWNQLRGVEASFSAHEIDRLEESTGFSWSPYFLKARETAKIILSRGGSGITEEQALVEGMVLGDTSGMSATMKEFFRFSGTGHIFAVSGQNLGVILGMLIVLFRNLKINSWRWGWLALIPLLFYAGLTGFQSSCIRSWIMLSLLLIAWRIDRPAAWLNFWSLTLIIILLVNPNAVLDLGYQLSFLVVLALIILTPPGMELLKPLWRWDPFLSRAYATPLQIASNRFLKIILSLMVGSFVAFLSVLPHSIFIFHSVNAFSIFLNLLVVPMAGGVVMMGTVSLILGSVVPILSIIPNKLVGFLAKGILYLVYHAATLSFLQFAVPDYHTWRWDPSPEMIILEGGEVPQALIRCQGEFWLLNCGNKNGYERTLHPLLKYYGVTSLDGHIATTVSESSNGALVALLKDYPIKKLVRPSAYSRSPLEKKWEREIPADRFCYWKKGSLYRWKDESSIRVIEDGATNEIQGTEDQGLVLDLMFQGQHLVWANRISGRLERVMSSSCVDEWSVETLIQGRNPNGENLTEEWLHFLKPKFLIIPRVGKKIQHTGIDPLWNLGKRTSAKVISLGQTGALRIEWRDLKQASPRPLFGREVDSLLDQKSPGHDPLKELP